MSKQSLIIYNLPVLYNILSEIKGYLKFELQYFSTKDDFKNLNNKNYIILTNSKNKIKNAIYQIIVDDFPIRIFQIIEKVNILLLKQKFENQSEILIGVYRLDLNSKKLFYKEKNIKLTERETEIIIFLKNSNESQSIENLQKKVWGHTSILETHTVETHIYRLRKKIIEIFDDDKFIISTKNGYKIL